VNVTNIVFENVYGTSSGAEGDVIAELICSPNAVCEGIQLKDINIETPEGEQGVVVCDGIPGGVGVDCVESSSA
jgi:galacturan 1,4-alpha-galacturonidase